MNEEVKMNEDEVVMCPCKSGKPYAECCEPILEGAKAALTAEELMRARYSAYATEHIKFLKTSAVAEVQREFDEEASTNWSRAAEWHGLEVIKVEGGSESDTTGKIEFRAMYSANGKFCNHHELADFVKEPDGWKFKDGELIPDEPTRREEPKIGRNDPCPCGSGKKYKKCCGK